MIDQLEMFSTGATPYAVRTVTREQIVHQNSKKAYHEERVSISKRGADVLRVIRNCEHALTDREVMQALGFTDPNSVRPRITELLDGGFIREAGTTVDSLTGKKVRKVTA